MKIPINNIIFDGIYIWAPLGPDLFINENTIEIFHPNLRFWGIEEGGNK